MVGLIYLKNADVSMTDRNSWAYWYDVINEKERNDYRFYNRYLNKDELALEVACGTGRIYLDMIEDGYEVHGLDISENMLAKLNQKADERGLDPEKLFHGDISSVDLDYNYDLVYYPFNSIAHINGDVNEQVSTFENIHSHLAEDGLFVFDIYVIDFDAVSDYGDLKSKTFDHDGNRYKFEKWSELLSPVEQRIRSYNRIINIDEGIIEWEDSHDLSLYPKQQIELILQQAGFSDYEFYDGFTKNPLVDESKQMGVVARK